ncbi:HupE/UreJ family protein [Roseovarius autotrophicus]|uniref:HupE/UreJ family protein n=1 Tax=Roseovarius autotrophicus TaxID=2824121 RepID=UPI0019DC7863|nr:HupE/UreJ family protein [Roseovarius autotrophicus]MBE0453099.1 HupE/UreJ family protein [Roseovarius sp.]
MKKTILLLALLGATPALAHHPMGGAAPQTLMHGLLSGLAHPVIGIDHFAFVILVGLAAALSGRMLAAPTAFIVATVAGTLLQLGGVVLPLAEPVIAGSVVALGALLLAGRKLDGTAALVGFAAIGLFHGWAYGEAVIGSEPMPVLAYLAGFAAVQFAIASGVAHLAARALATERGQGQTRIAAALCCGIGIAFALETLEAMIMA